RGVHRRRGGRDRGQRGRALDRRARRLARPDGPGARHRGRIERPDRDLRRPGARSPVLPDRAPSDGSRLHGARGPRGHPRGHRREPGRERRQVELARRGPAARRLPDPRDGLLLPARGAAAGLTPSSARNRPAERLPKRAVLRTLVALRRPLMTERRRHLASTSPIVPIIAPALLLGLASAFSAGCNGGGGSPTSPPPPSPTVSQANVIEALFLGEGPLSPSGAIGCRDTGVWTHFPHGSQVTAKLASSLSARERQVSESFLAEVPGMVFGGISLVVQSTPEADPIPASQEVTAATLPVPQIERICRVGAGGCTQIVFAGFGIARSARTVSKHLFDGAIHAHELGHGVYGLCHVDGTVYPQALMASP